MEFLSCRELFAAGGVREEELRYCQGEKKDDSEEGDEVKLLIDQSQLESGNTKKSTY